jgi:hypothetical protein
LLKFHELCTPKRFGDDVCQLFISGKVINIHLSLLDAHFDEVISSFSMLAHVVMNMVLAKCNC